MPPAGYKLKGRVLGKSQNYRKKSPPIKEGLLQFRGGHFEDCLSVAVLPVQQYLIQLVKEHGQSRDRVT
jgi:hypothetical protein